MFINMLTVLTEDDEEITKNNLLFEKVPQT